MKEYKRNIKEHFLMIMSKLSVSYKHKKQNKENVVNVINKTIEL